MLDSASYAMEMSMPLKSAKRKMKKSAMPLKAAMKKQAYMPNKNRAFEEEIDLHSIRNKQIKKEAFEELE